MPEQRIPDRPAASGDRLLGVVVTDDGGPPAAPALFGGSLLAQGAALLGGVVDELVVAGPGGIAAMPRAGLGPLGAIAGALDWAASEGFRCVLTIGADMEALPDGLLDRLMRRGPAFCTDAPVLGYWPAALGAQLLAHLEIDGDRSVRRWAESVGALPVGAHGTIGYAKAEEWATP